MATDIDTTLPALKFISGDTEEICRLCFSELQNERYFLDDCVRLRRTYYDESITFMDIFHELEVTMEPGLPQALCASCATSAISSFLLKKLVQYSNSKWEEAITKLTNSLDQSDTRGSSVRTAYLLITQDSNIMFTSRQNNSMKSKKAGLLKIKEILKSRNTYERAKKSLSVSICEECGESFASNHLLMKHMRVHSKTKYACSRCPKQFATQLQVQEHSERIHYPKKIQCPKCAKMFSTEKMLQYHDKLYHVAAMCKLCRIQFPSNKLLRAHLDKHSLNKCPRCTKSFLNKHTFKLHLKICGNLEGKQPNFFCDICNKGYARKNGLRSHLKTDHGFGNVLSCNWCSKKFDAHSRLKNHIVKHTKEKNYHCEQCGGKFVSQAALVYHVRLHTGEKPFPCDMCSESFLSASRRMEHKHRKHFGPSKECPICHVKFITGHQLRRHIQRHYNPQSKLYIDKNDPYSRHLPNDSDNLQAQQDFNTLKNLLSL